MTDPLQEFETRLNAARQQSAKMSGSAQSESGMSQQDKMSFQRGMRIGCDLLAGVGLGVFLGLAIDKSFDTRPFGLLVMFIIGSAAGMWNVFRSISGYDYAVGFRRSGGETAPSNLVMSVDIAKSKKTDTQQDV